MKLGTALALALGLTGAVFWYGAQQRRQGVLEGRLEPVSARVDTLRERVEIRDTLYVRTRVRFDSVVRVYDSVRLTDTLLVPSGDTVRVFIPRDVADETVSMCRQTLFALQSSCATKDTLITALHQKVKALEAMKGRRCAFRPGIGITGGSDIRGKANVVLGVTFGVSC